MAAAGAPPATGRAASMSPSVHVTEWSEAQVSQWLQSLGLDHLAPAFREHGINGDSLVLLDDDNLQEVGVSSVGQRLALLGEIYRLKETYDIPIEEGDYVPQSAFPTLSLTTASTADGPGSIAQVLSALQQRNERIAALETELSKVTIYLNRLQQDFAQVCQLVGLQKPLSYDAPPIFPFSPLRTENEPMMLLQPPDKLATPTGLSATQPSSTLFNGLASMPVSAASTRPPLTALTSANTSASGIHGAPASLTTASSTIELSGRGDASTSAATQAPNSAVPSSTTLPGFGGADSESTYRSFRVTLDDPCYRVLPAALKKYKINDDWKKYALIICHGNTERCVTYEEKPLLLFQKLKEAKQNPIFMLRHIRDVKNPIALAKAKAEARKQTSTGVPVVKVPIKDVQSASATPTQASAGTSSSASEAEGTSLSASSAMPRPSTAPATGVSEQGQLDSSKDGSTSDVAGEAAQKSQSAGAPPSSAPALSNGTAFNASKGNGSTSSETTSSKTQTHTLVALGSPEWAKAMAIRALKNGHNPDKPVVTGAATRLPASSPSNASSGSRSKSGASPSASVAGASGSKDATSQPRKYAIAIYPYPSERDDEFDVELGDTFVVLSKIHGWWAVERDSKADGEGDGQWVEVEVPTKDGASSSTKKRVKVVRTGWVPAGCLLEMSQPLGVAVPTLKEQRAEAEKAGQAAAAPEQSDGDADPATKTESKSARDEGGSSTSATATPTAATPATGSTTTTSSLPPPTYQPYMATFPIPPTLITSPSTPGIMLMDYTSPPEDKLALKKGDRLRVFKRYSHWSYCVQEGGGHGRGWVPSWYIGKASSSSSASSTSSRRTGNSSASATSNGSFAIGSAGSSSTGTSSRRTTALSAKSHASASTATSATSQNGSLSAIAGAGVKGSADLTADKVANGGTSTTGPGETGTGSTSAQSAQGASEAAAAGSTTNGSGPVTGAKNGTSSARTSPVLAKMALPSPSTETGGGVGSATASSGGVASSSTPSATTPTASSAPSSAPGPAT